MRVPAGVGWRENNKSNNFAAENNWMLVSNQQSKMACACTHLLLIIRGLLWCYYCRRTFICAISERLPVPACRRPSLENKSCLHALDIPQEMRPQETVYYFKDDLSYNTTFNIVASACTCLHAHNVHIFIARSLACSFTHTRSHTLWDGSMQHIHLQVISIYRHAL